MIHSNQVLHSTNFQDVSLAEGKRVVVVGNGKSAVDCAVEASKAPGALLFWDLARGHPQ
jgi:cation diffusion facilitator CzcD-associated flavoprotein CzcO